MQLEAGGRIGGSSSSNSAFGRGVPKGVIVLMTHRILRVGYGGAPRLDLSP